MDDSPTSRALLWATMKHDPGIEVVGEASDPHRAREMIKALSPDVLTLDVEMPRMDGLSFLQKLMRLRPMPVVIVSNRARPDSDITMRALSLGAVECIDASVLRNHTVGGHTICRAVKAASKARIRPTAAPEFRKTPTVFRPLDRVVIIGASTGGVDAISQIVDCLPANMVPTVIAQHMPEKFIASFAQRLDNRFSPTASLANDRKALSIGEIQICPGGGQHTELSLADGKLKLVGRPHNGEDVVPSIDRLMRSALPIAPKVVAVLLTGMGRDGAEGLRALKEAGATTIVQSGETSVVDGMPRAAREIGAASEVLGINEISPRLLELTGARPSTAM